MLGALSPLGFIARSLFALTLLQTNKQQKKEVISPNHGITAYLGLEGLLKITEP